MVGIGVCRLSAAFAMVLWLGGAAAAATSPDAIAGRWRATDAKLPSTLVLDISRCGDGWCGIMVTDAGRCENTVLHLNADLEGRLELDPRANWFGVKAVLEEGDRSLFLGGKAGIRYYAAARSYDYSRDFARSGVAECAPKPVS